MSGVFRTLRVQDGVPLYFQEHMEKLKRECQKFDVPSLASIKAFISQEKANSGIWRLKVTVLAKEVPEMQLSIEPYVRQDKPHRVGIYEAPFHRADCKIKSLPYTDRLMLLSWAHERGYDEVLTTNSDGYILEGAVSNVFWEEAGVLYFIERSLPYYEGLTQELIIQKTKKQVRFAKITPSQIKTKNLFLCNALKGTVSAFF